MSITQVRSTGESHKRGYHEIGWRKALLGSTYTNTCLLFTVYVMGGSTQTFSAGIITTWQNTEKRNPVEDPGWFGGDGKEAAGYPMKKLMGGACITQAES